MQEAESGSSGGILTKQPLASCPHCGKPVHATEPPKPGLGRMKWIFGIIVLALLTSVAGIALSLKNRSAVSTQRNGINVLSLRYDFSEKDPLSTIIYIHTTVHNNTDQVITGIQWQISYLEEGTGMVWESKPFTRKGMEFLRILPGETKKIMFFYRDEATFRVKTAEKVTCSGRVILYTSEPYDPSLHKQTGEMTLLAADEQ